MPLTARKQTIPARAEKHQDLVGLVGLPRCDFPRREAVVKLLCLAAVHNRSTALTCFGSLIDSAIPIRVNLKRRVIWTEAT